MDAAYYDIIYDKSTAYGLSKDTQGRYLEVWKAILSYLNPDDIVLDIGCGTGQLAKQMDLQGIRYEKGIDFSPVAIRIAKQRCPKLSFELADIRAFNYNSGSYTTAVLCEVLEHISDDLDVLGNIPAGKKVIFSVPSTGAQGHVRIFTSIYDVISRYDSLMEITSNTTVTFGSTKFFIIAGEKR